MVRAVCTTHAAHTEATDVQVPLDCSGPVQKVNIPDATAALGENKTANTMPSDMMTEEKQGGQNKRFDSPVAKVTKAHMHTNKEDVPPMAPAPLQKQFNEEKKGGRKRFESPVPKVAIAGSKEAVPPSAVSPARRQELNKLRERNMMNQRLG